MAHPRNNCVTFAILSLALVVAAGASQAEAQQTAGNIIGTVVDQDNRGIPGATVTATSPDTGFTRTVASDEEGVYRMLAMPVGVYTVSAEVSGFSRLELPNVAVNISRTTDLVLELRIARIAETVTVTGRASLVPKTSSTLGEIVDLQRLERLPLNGRQFANLAALVPGVGLGFHADLTKATQYTPQISGGNGRNINYLVDGGDNNDDTVGGLLQQFPLEAIQEFNVMTQRFDAQFGRSNGGVINVITRSGTNALHATGFTFLRDESLNARTFSERLTQTPKQTYQRYQFGGSVGGPIVMDRVHFFAAYERTQQDTRQAVNTQGLFPGEDGVYDTPVRQNLFTAKVTAAATPAHYLSFRYAVDTNSQPNGAGLLAAPSSWTTSGNRFHSFNASDNWIVGGTRLNEFVFQYSRFRNEIPGSSAGPFLQFPNRVTSGASPVAPQSTEQDKWQFRNDYSWSLTGVGVGHDFKAGVSWIHEPHLFISTTAGSSGMYTMAENNINGAVSSVMVIGGASAVNIPLDQYGVYVKDDWRATRRLTLNLGLRWDYVSGMPIDQDGNPNFVAMQAAGRTGRFAGTALEAFGQEPRGDWDNIQPRIGFAFDVAGNGRHVVRGGWGIYTDFAYTNANALTPAIDAAGGSGLVFFAQNPTGLLKRDGTLFRASDPLSVIAHLNAVDPSVPPLAGMVLSPRLEQPYTRQASIGWAYELDPRTAVSADYARVTGHDLNLRLRPNTLINGRRALADLVPPIQPRSFAFRTAISGGSSEYDGLTLSVRRRMANLDLSAWYTLASASSTIGSASDELDANVIQDARNPFGPVQNAPSTRTDARHRFTLSAIVSAPWGIQVAPVFYYRSPLPIQTTDGRDFNGDGNANDITAAAYRYTGLNEAGIATFEEIGACETVNCSRRAPFSQMNLRVSRGFSIGGRTRLEAIAEVFNLFNATNPSLPLTTTRVAPSSAAPEGLPLASFMQPTAFAGDFQQPEQRVGQLGFRISF